MKRYEQETTCEWVHQNIDAYLDGALTPVDTRRLESHLRTCAACTDEAAFAKRVKHTLRALPEQHCPDRIVTAVFDQVGIRDQAPHQPRKHKWSNWWRTYKWGLAIVTVLLLALVIPLFIGIRLQSHRRELARQELARAEQQIELTFAYLRQVSNRSVQIVQENVIEPKVMFPIKRAFYNVLHPRDIPFENKKNKEESRCVNSHVS